MNTTVAKLMMLRGKSIGGNTCDGHSDGGNCSSSSSSSSSREEIYGSAVYFDLDTDCLCSTGSPHWSSSSSSSYTTDHPIDLFADFYLFRTIAVVKLTSPQQIYAAFRDFLRSILLSNLARCVVIFEEQYVINCNISKFLCLSQAVPPPDEPSLNRHKIMHDIITSFVFHDFLKRFGAALHKIKVVEYDR